MIKWKLFKILIKLQKKKLPCFVETSGHRMYCINCICMVTRGRLIVFPDWSHNTEILSYKSSIDHHWRSILEELILHIAPTAGQYKKILPSRLSHTGELNFNIIMFSWEWPVMTKLKTVCIFHQLNYDAYNAKLQLTVVIETSGKIAWSKIGLWWQNKN